MPLPQIRCVIDIARMPHLLDHEANFKVELPRKLDEYREEDLRSIGLSIVLRLPCAGDYFVARTLAGKNYFVGMEKECEENRLMRLHVFSYTLSEDMDNMLSKAEYERNSKKQSLQKVSL